MERRRVLAVLGASLSVAGCLSEAPMANESAPDTPDEADTAFSIGAPNDDVNAHGLTVQNTGDTSRRVALRVSEPAIDETHLDRTYSLTDGGEIRGELRGPAVYEVSVSLAAEGNQRLVSVDYFDTCNEYETIVSITQDGTITGETLTTDLECPPA